MSLHETCCNPSRSRQRVLLLVQISFLGLFIALHLMGLTRIWLFILIAGFVASLFFGRVYCRAVCPVSTFNRLAALLPRGMRLRKSKAPGWLAHPVFRVAWFSILLATLVIAMIRGLRFHLFTIITASGIILCRAFPAAAWCNVLCPWGALLRATPSIRRFDGKPDSCGT
jgi:NosR/NirI family transcriptional regulator, nitrous oxide reductase regulator